MASIADRKGVVGAMACLTAALVSGMAASVLARWPGDPAVNVPICTERYNQWYSSIATDGSAGAIITWEDYRYHPGTDIYAQRVDSAGVVRWDSNGVSICGAVDWQLFPLVVADQSGGAIIAWRDLRNVLHWGDVYAQRVDSLGQAQWEPNGVPVCTTASDQRLHSVVPDGSGGAVLVWGDSLASQDLDIRAQRIDGNGNLLWPEEGVPVCTASGNQVYPVMTSDGAGGAVMVWLDDRRVGQSDIYAQRVSSGGLVQWAVDGVPVCTADDIQRSPAISSDSSGGAIVVWTDYRSTGADVYAQRVDSSGRVGWTENGILVSPGSLPRITEDGSGGAIIAISWQPYGLYAQRVDAEGDLRWNPAGVPICTTYSGYHRTTLISDGSGGAVVAWSDERGGGCEWDIYAQRVDSTGNTLWPEQGVAISTAPSEQIDPLAVSDGSGGAIMTWGDGREPWPSGDNIYAQRVYADGSLTEAGGLVTGGGWIPGGAGRRNFGFNVHSEAGAVWGQLQFNDHGIGLRVHSDTIAVLVIQPGDTIANFAGDCRVDGLSGYSFDCQVMDRGEPGHGVDWFSIEIHDGNDSLYYRAADWLGGGNIQIHREAAGSFKGDFCDTDLHPDSEPNTPEEFVKKPQVLVPRDQLLSNSPNPFSASTTIHYSLSAHSRPRTAVSLGVYDLSGRLVRTLANGTQVAGHHAVEWDGKDDGGSRVPAGVYFYALTAEGLTATRKTVVLE